MILKKPYGLLIKHFKLIHFILTVLMIVLASQTKTTLDFFSDYVANNYSVSVIDNMVSIYISPFIYVVLVLIFIILIALFVLLRYKKKPNNIYLATIGYYVFLFIMIVVASVLIGSLSEGLWEAATARQFRDFSQLFYWPQYIFIIIMAVRALGFNIKQFNFKDDIKDLDLSEEDSELVELNLGFDTSRIEKFIRRMIREFMYYFKENKFIFVLFGGIVLVIIVMTGFKGYEITHFTYRQGKSFNYDNFKIVIEDSIITNVDYNGNLLSEDSYYVVAKLNVTNNYKEKRALDYKNFKIYVGRDYYYPTLDLGVNFIDYGKPYLGEKFNAKETKQFILTYVIDKKYAKRDLAITLYSGVSLKKKNYTPKTITLKLKPTTIGDEDVVLNSKLNSVVSLGGTYLKNSTLTVTDVSIGSKYNYKYEYCVNKDCKEYSDFVMATHSKNDPKTLLVFDYDYSIDNTSDYYLNAADSFNNFVTNFVKVKYYVVGVPLVAEVKNITPTNMKGKVALELTKNIEVAERIELYITIRNKTYIIDLNKE